MCVCVCLWGEGVIILVREFSFFDEMMQEGYIRQNVGIKFLTGFFRPPLIS